MGRIHRAGAIGDAQAGVHTQREEGAQHHAAEPPAPFRVAPFFLLPLRHLATSGTHSPQPLLLTPAQNVHHSPTSFTSGSSRTPVCSSTRRRARSISSRTSLACAPPRLTIKFACRSDTAAPPLRS